MYCLLSHRVNHKVTFQAVYFLQVVKSKAIDDGSSVFTNLEGCLIENTHFLFYWFLFQKP